MAVLKNALTQLASMLNLQYTVLSTKGDELEAQQVAFAAIADITKRLGEPLRVYLIK